MKKLLVTLILSLMSVLAFANESVYWGKLDLFRNSSVVNIFPSLPPVITSSAAISDIPARINVQKDESGSDVLVELQAGEDTLSFNLVKADLVNETIGFHSFEQEMDGFTLVTFIQKLSDGNYAIVMEGRTKGGSFPIAGFQTESENQDFWRLHLERKEEMNRDERTPFEAGPTIPTQEEDLSHVKGLVEGA